MLSENLIFPKRTFVGMLNLQENNHTKLLEKLIKQFSNVIRSEFMNKTWLLRLIIKNNVNSSAL